MCLHLGLKHPTSQSGSTELAEVLRRGWLFGVTYHNMRGAIASATAAWAILLDRSAVIRKCLNSRKRIHNVFEDPAAIQGTEEDRLALFRRVRNEIRDFLKSFPESAG